MPKAGDLNVDSAGRKASGRGTAFITGITGFVGPYLAKRLLESGFEVYGLFRRRADGVRPLRLVQKDIIEDVKLLEGDVTDLTSLIFALDKCRPDLVFHLASQSFVPRSFGDPQETFRVNSLGTQNLLEAARLRDIDCKMIFAGSSEEYGLQIHSQKHLDWATEKYGKVIPTPRFIPELPVCEDNYLRPMSPYAVSKLQGDYLWRNYFYAYGLKTIVSRAFNHEGAGRGNEFVTSSVVRQGVSYKLGETSKISIGNVGVFRDWSHVEDIVNGYVTIASKGAAGEVYNQGSARANSVLTYILMTLGLLGYDVKEVEALKGGKKVRSPLEADDQEFFGRRFEKSRMDALLLSDELSYRLEDGGLRVLTDKGDVRIEFNPSMFRPADVPILMCDPGKAKKLGFVVTKKLQDVIRDQIDYYLNPDNRRMG